MADLITSAGKAIARARRSPHFVPALVLLAGALGVMALGTRAPRPVLVWNASASAPIGFYAVSAPAGLKRGDMVIARLPCRFVRLAAARHYLPIGVPLVKRVEAGPGDWICVAGASLTLPEGRSVVRLRRDRAGRPMPAWRGCGRLPSARYLLVMTDAPQSFDGRYFGPISRRDIVGKAHLLWAR